MEDPIPCHPPPPPNPNSQIDHLQSLPSPPMDHDFLTEDFYFPDNFSSDDFPFDIDFTVDDIAFTDDLLLDPQLQLESDVSHDRSPNLDDNQHSNVTLGEENHGPVSSEDSNVCKKSNCMSPEFDNCKSDSGVSHGSGKNSACDVNSRSFNYENDNDDDDDDNDSKLSGNEGLEKKPKVEGVVGSKNMSKRKKDQERGDNSSEGRISKLRRSSTGITESGSFNLGNDEDEKRKARLMRNRESAHLSRQRKKQYVEELEDKVRAMHSMITELNGKVSCVMAENATLRQQLSGGAGVCQTPPTMGMYPIAPMPYPWMPCPPYMVKHQGSKVPLVPIPRLKPQQHSPPSKADKNKKNEKKKKSEGKIKKVASVSLLGLLFFFLLFGGLVPMINVKYGGIRDGFTGFHKGRVLMVDNHMNYERGVGIIDGKGSHGRVGLLPNSSEDFLPMANSSEPLVASLYVPRNDKLAKIDGNLIIHSVLASERAMGSHKESGGGVKKSEETAIAASYPHYPISGTGRSNCGCEGNSHARQRALPSAYSDKSKLTGSEGELQQWFHEGLAGPMLSSGMCTEVFQFDISPAPGSIVPATSIANATSVQRWNSSSHPNKPRNRRILQEYPIPLNGRALNVTEEHVHSSKQNSGLHGNKSHSSLIVSVLVDPREVGDADDEAVIRSKTLSKIFVVVLIDSVKYVTYSCMLPFLGSGNHLVTN